MLNKLLLIPGVHLFLYGKAESRPFRKMGHVTIVDEDRNKLIEKVAQVKQTIKAVTLQEQESQA